MGAWDDDFGNLIKVQAAPPVGPQAGTVPPQSAWDQDFGAFNKDQPSDLSTSKPDASYAEPDAPTWMGRGAQMIRGKQDPRYKNVPTYSEPHESAAGMGALVSGVDDHGLTDVLRKELGPRFRKTFNDANGYPIIEYMSADGKLRQEYVNKPGLDAADAMRGLIGAVPYVAAGSLVNKVAGGLGTLGQAIAQGVGAGATNVAAQGGRQASGSDQGFSPSETAITAAAAAGGQLVAPALGAVWRKFVSEPRLFNKAAGSLTSEGEAAAKAAGLDPSALTSEIQKEFAQEYARTGSTTIGRSVASKEFDIPVSKGQLTKDPGQLLNEKGMRYNVYGQRAKDIISEFDQRQASAVEAAARGDGPKSIAATINPNTPAVGTRPGDLGSSIRSGVQEAEQAASSSASAEWKNVGKIVPSPEAMAEIPQFIGPRLGSLPIDPKRTPIAAGMADDLRSFMKGKLPEDYVDITGRQAIPDAIELRQRLFKVMRGAENDVDAASARAIYEGYGDWLEKSAATALKGGDPMQYAALKAATDKTRELKAVFGEAGVNGSSPGRKIVQSILTGEEAATPEAIVSKLFSVDPGAVPKAGAQEAISLIKQGLDKYAAPETAKTTWNDLRLAAWKRIIEDNSGRLHTPTMLAQRIDKAFNAQGTMMNQLYSPEERALIKRFSLAMKDISAKDPNASGSGTAGAYYVSQLGQAVFKLLGNTNGPVARIFQTIIGSTPIRNAVGDVAARSATAPFIRSQTPVIAPYGAAAYQSAQDARR